MLGPDLLIEVPDVPSGLDGHDRRIAGGADRNADPLAPENFLESNPDELNRLIAANLVAAGDFATGSIHIGTSACFAPRRPGGDVLRRVPIQDPSLDIVLPASL